MNKLQRIDARCASFLRGARLSTAAGVTAFAVIVGVGTALAQPPQNSAAKPTATTKELMETTITDASNAVWNAFEPPASDEQWRALEEAATTLIDAAKRNAIGGTGPKDKEWAAAPAWKPFNDAMLHASESALKAIREKNHEALLAAGDELYPPCEGCHLLFNPGVVEQN